MVPLERVRLAPVPVRVNAVELIVWSYFSRPEPVRCNPKIVRLREVFELQTACAPSPNPLMLYPLSAAVVVSSTVFSPSKVVSLVPVAKVRVTVTPVILVAKGLVGHPPEPEPPEKARV